MTFQRWLIGSAIGCSMLMAVLFLTFERGRERGRQEVTLAWNTQRTADALASARAAQQARQVEQSLQASIETIKQEKARELEALDRYHTAALVRLRQRASRPGDYVPAPATDAGAGAVAGCGADRLYREDGAVALGIARDADITRAALMECRASYEAAQRTMAGEAEP